MSKPLKISTLPNNVAARADREHQLNDHRQSPAVWCCRLDKDWKRDIFSRSDPSGIQTIPTGKCGLGDCGGRDCKLAPS
mgnify:CR=1 FL=1